MKVLFIAHYFPPFGGAGTQRTSKFVKYLPSFGIQPLILTRGMEMKDQWSPEDESLEADIPSGLQIFRCEWTCAESCVFSKARKEAMIGLGMSIMVDCRPSLIFVTMSPFEDAAVAAELSARSGIPWIADLRDPWALDEFQVFKSGAHRTMARRRMGEILRSASLIIMNTPESMCRFQSAFPGFSPKVVNITNGYDSKDFADLGSQELSSKFTIVHSGHFHTQMGLRQQRRTFEYRILGRVEPGVKFLSRSHFYLIKALEYLSNTDPELTGNIRVLCIGKTSAEDRFAVSGSRVAGCFDFQEYLPHAESVAHIRSANLLFLPMHKLPPGRRATIVPGKTYEYMATGRPVLAAVPEGDARDFLTMAGTGRVCEPDDVLGMAAIIKAEYLAWNSDGTTSPWRPHYVEQFERKRLSERLAKEFHELCVDRSMGWNCKTTQKLDGTWSIPDRE